MKRIIIGSLLLLVINISLFAITWQIKQDGTGDFTSISEGISNAQDGDRVLVFPGIYYENIDFQGKNITLTSLYNEAEDNREIIAETVIDGNRSGSVITFKNGETRNAVLNGFTLQNGSGDYHWSTGVTQGGGIYVSRASPTIRNCIIERNRARWGGGIEVFTDGNPYLRGCTIRYNNAIQTGGGVRSVSRSGIEFCTVNPNNIYLNHAFSGSDLLLGGSPQEQEDVLIDTFTVLEPDRYFLRLSIEVMNSINVTILNGKIEPVAADLHVSPFGNDENSGLSPEEPLKTIAYAMSLIKPDEAERRNVYVAEGIYSPTLNNQIFPVQLRENVNLIGAGKETTILDAEHISLHFGVWFARTVHPGGLIRNFSAQNFTLRNGGDTGTGRYNSSVFMLSATSFEFENIHFENCHSYGLSTFQSNRAAGDYSLRNLSFYNNSGGYGALHLGHENDYFNVHLENIRIRRMGPGPFDPNYIGGYGLGFMFRGPELSTPISSKATIVNLEVTDCLIDSDNIDPMWASFPLGNLNILGSGEFKLINATIGNNVMTGLRGGGINVGPNAMVIDIYNSIIYGNEPHNFVIEGESHTEPGYVNVYNSLIGGGEEGIYYHRPNAFVHWDETNIDADPLWMGELNPDFPYMLQEGSPAINAGTLDIPDFELPEFDLAGNPRIMNGRIDIGAYEFQGETSVGKDELAEETPKIDTFNYRLRNYPNPVMLSTGEGQVTRSNGGTNISFRIPKDSRVQIDIYNAKGQFVRRLVDASLVKGEYNPFWNGKDEQEREVSSGMYLYQLQVDGNVVSAGRCTVVR